MTNDVIRKSSLFLHRLLVDRETRSYLIKSLFKKFDCFPSINSQPEPINGPERKHFARHPFQFSVYTVVSEKFGFREQVMIILQGLLHHRLSTRTANRWSLAWLEQAAPPGQRSSPRLASSASWAPSASGQQPGNTWAEVRSESKKKEFWALPQNCAKNISKWYDLGIFLQPSLQRMRPKTNVEI